MHSPVQQKRRYKNIRAGLDNAVSQSEARDLRKMFIVDADCHQHEAFALIAEFMPKDSPFREVFLRPDTDDQSFEATHLSAEGGHQFSGRIRHGRKRIRSEVTYPARQKPDELIDLYTSRMYDLGIKRSIVFPTPLLYLSMDKSSDFEVEATNAYVDYMLEHFLGKHKEILSPVIVPVNSPDKAAELIDRVGSEKGIVGVTVPSVTPVLSGDTKWNPIYEAAQKKGLPICMHSNTYSGGSFSGFDKLIGLHTLCRPMTLMIQITSMIYSGVPERFKKLKFVFVEGGVTWIPWLMQRMDSEFIMRREEAPLLTKMPSEYMQDFYYTSQPLEYTAPENLEYAFHMFDAENKLLFASDYPHWDFDVPSTIFDLPFLTMRQKEKIMGKNAVKLFHIT
jgi:predicted TIM-barrel fold metal-dependent hydrolase